MTKSFTSYYSPFGSCIQELQYTYSDAGETSKYRFGFNGKESDSETDLQDYGFRIYYAKLGRFLSIDPYSNLYPFYSPFQYSSNNPTFSIDVDGLEAAKIINAAEGLLYTPYEFGGKNPSPSIIGYIKTEAGLKEWTDLLKPKLKLIAANHPNLHSDKKKEDYNKVKNEVYNLFEKYTKKEGKLNGYSLGIDCSGFVFKSYKADEQLLFSGLSLNTGSIGQLSVFRNAQVSGKAFVHKNFSKISKGDFIYKPGHVMIASGRIKVDKNGKVIAFQTLEANDTEHGSIIKWRNVDESYTIGHPFRKTDITTKEIDVIDDITKLTTKKTVDLNGEERTEKNLEQEVVK